MRDTRAGHADAAFGVSGTRAWAACRRAATPQPAAGLRVLAIAGAAAWPGAARADGAILDAIAAAFTALDRHEVAVLALTVGVIFFAVLTAIALLRTRNRAAHSDAAARAEISALRSAADRLTALMLGEPQVVISWTAAGDLPEITGDAGFITGSQVAQRVLAFGTWLAPDQAQALEQAIAALRALGEGFTMPMATLDGRAIEADGRAIGGRAVVRLRDVSGARRELAETRAAHDRLRADSAALRALFEAYAAPIWMRDCDAKLTGANPAFLRAVEAADLADANARGVDLIDRAGREAIARACAAGDGHAARHPVIVAGHRRMLDVHELPSARGSVGIGIDVTEVETLRAEIARLTAAHRRTLDQLGTGVAIFGADHRLNFCNASYRALWNLDAAFLDQAPSDSAVLDRLRAARRLPEQPDFRQWKRELHEAYHAIEAREQEWHLPDGRTLRVVTTPNPEGGVAYLFDDVTERLDLERRFDSLIKVQGATLDNLAEALAVFGSDGRLRLRNPAFMRLWKLSADTLGERPHVETVIELCRPLHRDEATWTTLRAAVTTLDGRQPISRRIERNDGAVVDCTSVPLPDGSTLVAFQDITDSINVERALRERNEALEAADQLKLDFVHHVSYELRSPLTNIIGFAHFLGDAATGPLTEKQHEYLGYITVSTNALMAIINNILDLATVDAGAMTLSLGEVDVNAAMAAAAEGVQDRLVKDDITLDIRADSGIGVMRADERRLRQVLFNLLSNAVGFSPRGETVTLAAVRTSGAVVFSVTDRGPGIPPDRQGRVFDLFETSGNGSRHRGAGLGLSIVRSFVELHGGRVGIESAPGRGTTVVCTFPLAQAAARPAAE